jgi:hypothetical protein
MVTCGHEAINLEIYFRIPLGYTVIKGIDFSHLNVCSGCRASITSVNGTVSSPAFGLSDYPSNQECLFNIKKPGGGALSLKFEDFDVHQSDFVQVRYEN